MTRLLFPVALGIIVSVAATSGAPARTLASKTVTDVRKACQIKVPDEWTDQTGTAYGPGKRVSATVHAGRAGQTFDQAKAAAKTAMKPVQIRQDDAKRIEYTFDPGNLGGAGKYGLYVVLNTSPVCSVSFIFPAGTDDDVLKKITESLAVVK